MQNKNKLNIMYISVSLSQQKACIKNYPRIVHLPRNDTLNNEWNIRTEGTLQRNESNWTKSFISLSVKFYFFSYLQSSVLLSFCITKMVKHSKSISRRARVRDTEIKYQKQTLSPQTNSHTQTNEHTKQTQTHNCERASFTYRTENCAWKMKTGNIKLAQVE